MLRVSVGYDGDLPSVREFRRVRLRALESIEFFGGVPGDFGGNAHRGTR